jgi:hypothetical protein
MDEGFSSDGGSAASADTNDMNNMDVANMADADVSEVDLEPLDDELNVESTGAMIDLSEDAERPEFAALDDVPPDGDVSDAEPDSPMGIDLQPLDDEEFKANITDLEAETKDEVADVNTFRLDAQEDSADTLPTEIDELVDFASDRDNEGVYQKYMDALQAGQVELVEKDAMEQRTIPASDISGMRWRDDVPDEQFWNHHGNTKETYLDLAAKIPRVKDALDGGKSLDEIKGDEELRACAEQYFSPDEMVRVMQYGDKYLFGSDGRHRIMAAREFGQEIPVRVTHEVKLLN